jgi:polo-like kinase 1
MLTGHPPFETARQKLTYEHIKSCQYRFPPEVRLSGEARDFVKIILQLRPESRPSAQDLSMHDFLQGPTVSFQQRPQFRPTPPAMLPDRGLAARFDHRRRLLPEPIPTPVDNLPKYDFDKVGESEVISFPKSCVARFCDHSEKYGLGYLLVDGTIGACFNDLSRMVMDPYETFVQYWENYQTTTPVIMDVRTGPEQKKLCLLRRFSESLKSTKSMYELPDERYSDAVPMRHVKYWMRNDDAALFRMDNRNIQVNFNDRKKVIIFWNAKKMLMVQSIRETGKLIPLAEVNAQGPLSEERRRIQVAKAMLAEMSGR